MTDIITIQEATIITNKTVKRLFRKRVKTLLENHPNLIETINKEILKVVKRGGYFTYIRYDTLSITDSEASTLAAYIRKSGYNADTRFLTQGGYHLCIDWLAEGR